MVLDFYLFLRIQNMLAPFLLRILDNEKPGMDCKTSFTVHASSFHRLISGLKLISISVEKVNKWLKIAKKTYYINNNAMETIYLPNIGSYLHYLSLHLVF